MFENPRRGRKARNFTTNVPKILDLKTSSEQIFSENWRWVPLTYLRIFFWNLFMSLDFVNQHVFLVYIETAQNSHEECNEYTDLLFWRLSLCLSRESLSCDTRSLDLCILFKFILLYLRYIPPHSCAFHTVYFTPIFSDVYYYANFCFLFLMTLLLGI